MTYNGIAVYSHGGEYLNPFVKIQIGNTILMKPVIYVPCAGMPTSLNIVRALRCKLWEIRNDYIGLVWSICRG